MTDEDDIIAAEWALGLLEGAEADAAGARIAADPALAARAQWWREQFAELGEDAPAPSDWVWTQVLRVLPGNDNSAGQVRRWRAAAAAMAMVAVGLGTALALRPGVPEPAADTTVAVAPPTAPMLLASLAGDKGVAATIAFDPLHSRLNIAPATLDRGNGDAELWIIPEGGAPRSLGVIDVARTAAVDLPPAQSGMIVPGATFAISIEKRGGSTTGAPGGPVVATGKISST